jgi:uncharacterized membrane protein YdjX (TVP38/TMEM64 family)
MEALKKSWPWALLGTIVLVALAFGLRRHMSWSVIAAHGATLRAFVDHWPVAAAVAYVAVYAAVVAVSLPIAELMTVTGGLMFGTISGTVLAVLGAGSGAVLVFLLARRLFCEALACRTNPTLVRVHERLEQDGFSYLLALRFVPLVPFWITNLAAALVGMRLAPYAAATFIGIIPVTAVFTSIGASLRDVLMRSERPHFHIIFTPPVLLPLLALGLLALLPIAWRHLRPARA